MLLLLAWPSLSKADFHWFWSSYLCEPVLRVSPEWVFLSCVCCLDSRMASLRRTCSSLGWETTSSSSWNYRVLPLPIACLSSSSCSAFFFSYSARSNSNLVHASLHCLAWCRRPCLFLFFLSLFCLWSSVSLSWPWTSGDIFDSNSSKDLTSGAAGKISGEQGRWIMITFQVWGALVLLFFRVVREFMWLFHNHKADPPFGMAGP